MSDANKLMVGDRVRVPAATRILGDGGERFLDAPPLEPAFRTYH